MLTNVTAAPRHPRTLTAAKSPRRSQRAVDLLLTMLLLAPALPMMAVLWLLVRLTSRGPAFYSQLRAGHQGQTFRIHKFRTMTWNCERSTGAVWATKDDPRITPLGRILRKTHLDELPQLFDVLRGDMALVGPRPERPEIIERLLPDVPRYLDRLVVPPGVTGLAQIFWDSDLTIDDVRRKLKFDRWYIAHRSLWLDLRIVFCTALKVVGLNRPFVREILFPIASVELNAFLPAPVPRVDFV